MIIVHTPKQLLFGLRFQVSPDQNSTYFDKLKQVEALTVEGWTRIFKGNEEDCISVIEAIKVAVIEGAKCITIIKEGAV